MSIENDDDLDDAQMAADTLMSALDNRASKLRNQGERLRRATSGTVGPEVVNKRQAAANKGSPAKATKEMRRLAEAVEIQGEEVSVMASLIRRSQEGAVKQLSAGNRQQQALIKRVDKNMAFLAKTFAKPLAVKDVRPRTTVAKKVTGPESNWVKKRPRAAAPINGSDGGGLFSSMGGLGLAEMILGALGLGDMLGGGRGKGGKPRVPRGGGRMGKLGAAISTTAAGIKSLGSKMGTAARTVGAATASTAATTASVVSNATKAVATAPATQRAVQAAATAPKSGMVGGVLKKVPVLGTILAGAEIAASETDSSTSREQKNENLAGIGGGLAGGLAGAKLGAGLGAAVGSFVPVVGTAIGAGVGGIVGGIGGSLMGDKAGRMLLPAGSPGQVSAERESAVEQAKIDAMERLANSLEKRADEQIHAIDSNSESLRNLEKQGFWEKIGNIGSQIRTGVAYGAATAGRWMADKTEATGKAVREFTAAPEGSGAVRKAIASGGAYAADRLTGAAHQTRVQTAKTAEAVAGPGGGLANLIAKHESGKAGYNAYNTGTVGQGKSPIDLENMSIGELKRRQALPKGDPDRIFAAGKYQAIPGTMKEAQAALGFTDDQKFTKELQDQIFADYLVGQKRKDVKNYISGKSDNLVAAEDGMAKEFASIYSPTKGKGWYDGDSAGNKASGRSDTNLKLARESYAAHKAAGLSDEEAYRKAVLGSKEAAALPVEARAKPGLMSEAVASDKIDRSKAPTIDTKPTAALPLNDGNTYSNPGQSILDENGKLKASMGIKSDPNDPDIKEAVALGRAPGAHTRESKTLTKAEMDAELKSNGLMTVSQFEGMAKSGKSAADIAASQKGSLEAQARAHNPIPNASPEGIKKAAATLVKDGKAMEQSLPTLAASQATAFARQQEKPVIIGKPEARTAEPNANADLIGAIGSLKSAVEAGNSKVAAAVEANKPAQGDKLGGANITLDNVPDRIPDLSLMMLVKGIS